MLARLAIALLLALGQGENLNSILQALEQNDVEKADQLLQEVLLQNPDDPQILHVTGIVKSRQGKHQEAETAFRRAIELAPDELEFYLDFAQFYGDQSKWNNARVVLEEAWSRLPFNPDLNLRLAVVEAERLNFPQAIMYLKAISEDMAPPQYWETVGRVLVSTRDFEGAEQAYLRVLEAEPDSIPTLRILSGIALKRKDTETAWAYIARARKLAPNSPQVLYDFGQVSLLHYLIAEATSVARLLRLMDPDNPDYLFFLGRCLLSDDANVRAAELFRQYIELRPQDENGFMMLGLALDGNAQYAEALESFQKALSMKPDLIEAVYNTGQTYYSLGRDEEAEHELLKVLREVADHWKAHLALGKLYLRQKKLEAAQEHLETAARLQPQSSDVYFQLSRTFRLMGEEEAAKEALEIYRKNKAEEQRRRDSAHELPFVLGQSSDR